MNQFSEKDHATMVGLIAAAHARIYERVRKVAAKFGNRMPPYSITVLDVRPNDIVVAKFHAHITQATAVRMREILDELGIERALVIDAGTDMAVLRGEVKRA